VRRKTDFVCIFNAPMRVQSSAQKYISFAFSENMIGCRHPASTGGAYRDRHDTRGGQAVAALSRATNGFDAVGEIVWSWPPGAEAVRRRIPRRAGGNKPVPKESAYKPSNIAQGMPDDRLHLW
jgi:hypothetical protein